jgi:hypothetical protein
MKKKQDEERPYQGAGHADTMSDVFDMPPCMSCKHLLHVGTQDLTSGWTCKAWPTEIPWSILTRERKHDVVVPHTQEGDYVFDSHLIDFPDGTVRKEDWDGKLIIVGRAKKKG